MLALTGDISPLPLVGATVSRLSVYATLILTARLLDAEQFGAYAVCLVAIGILSAVVSGGGDMWLNRFTGETASTKGQAARLWVVYFAVVLAISLVLLAAVSLIVLLELVPEPFGDLAIATVSASALMGCTEAILATMRSGGTLEFFFVTRDIVIPLLYLALLASFGPATTLDALLIYLNLWLAAFLAVALRLLWRAPTTLPAVLPPRQAWIPVLRHTFGLIYGNLTSRLAIHIDVLALTTAASMAIIGEYRVAAQFAIGFMVIQHFVFLGLPWQMRSSGRADGGTLGLAIVADRQRSLLLLAAGGGALLWVLADPVLALLGDRFVNMTPIFRLLLVLRFSSLLWGPQHEILISNGFSIEDAHANVVSIGVWSVAFSMLLSVVGSMHAAVLATVVATLALHLTRLWSLRRHGLPPIYGHPFGVVAPVAVLLLVGLAAVWQAAW